MKTLIKISGLLLAIFLANSLAAQDYDCYIKKTFPSSVGMSLRVTNKYGDINIINTKDDSVSVCVTITIIQDDKEMARKSMDLISVKIDRLKDTISATTSFNRKFFSQTYRQGRKNFSVDYLLKVPAYLGVNVSNEFGNVAVDELSGYVNIRLSQGIFSARKLTRENIKPINEIYVDNGKVSIDELNWIKIIVRNCQSVNIENAKALLINSEFSKISLGEISSLVSLSKSDNYEIGSIKNIVSESLYSAFEIGKLSGQLKSTTTFGSMTVNDLKKDFSTIDLSANQSPVIIKTGEGVTFKSDILLTNSTVDFPFKKYPGIIKSESNNTITMVGIAGENKQTNSLIRIRQKSGSLTIR